MFELAHGRTISPVGGRIYVERELASPGELETALGRARAAARTWGRVAVAERARLVTWS